MCAAAHGELVLDVDVVDRQPHMMINNNHKTRGEKTPAFSKINRSEEPFRGAAEEPFQIRAAQRVLSSKNKEPLHQHLLFRQSI